jgi:tetratricopeptide (TPR) repeat protein
MRQKLYPPAQFPAGHRDLAGSLNSMGVQFLLQHLYAEALPYLEQALAMRQKLYPASQYPMGHSDLAVGLGNLGVLLVKQGRPEEALPYYEQQLAMLQKMYPQAQFPDGHPDLALCLNNLAGLHSAQEQYARAVSYYEQALAMFQKLYPAAKYPDGHPDIARCLRNLASVLRDQKQHAQALPYYEQALAMYQKLYPADKYPAGHPYLALTLQDLGSHLSERGRQVQALPYYEQALAMRQKMYPAAKFPQGHREVVASLNNLGHLLWAQGRYAQAQPLFEQALEMSQKLFPNALFPDGHAFLAGCLNNRGSLLRDQGQYQEARPYLEQAQTMYQKLYPASKYPNGHPAVAESLKSLGGLFEDQGQYAQALPYYEQALAMDQKLYPATSFPAGHPRLAKSLSNLASLHWAQGHDSKALAYLEQSLAMYQQQAEHFAEGATESEALALNRSLPHVRDGLLSVSGPLPDRVERTYGLLWSGRDALNRIWQQRHLATLAAAGRPEVRDRWGDLLDTRRLDRLLLQPLPPDGPARTARDRTVQQLTDRKESLQRELTPSLPALAAAQRGHSRPADLQAGLPPHTAFLDLFHYLRFERNPQATGKEALRTTPCYVAFVVQAGQGVRRVELGEAEPIERALDAWRRAILQRTHSAAARDLRRLVWEPLEQQLAAGTETVYLAPDGALTRLPWAALPGRQPDTVLLEAYTLGLVEHGPHLLAALRRPAGPAPSAGPMLLVGGVRYDQAPSPTPPLKGQLLAQRGPERDGATLHWDELSGTAREVRLVKTAGGNRPIAVLDQQAASVGRLLRELPQARLAHVATHGFFNERTFREEQEREAELVRSYAFAPDRQLVLPGQGARSPLAYTGLVLAGANIPDKAGPEGGILTGELLLEVKLEGLQLAVLSACQTGLGEVAGDQCVQNLGKALHAAGCRDVVASLWNVPDDATAALMALFYDELLAKKRPPLEALRQAQLYVYRHPEKVKEVAERGPPSRKQEEKVPTGTAEGPARSTARAAVKDWAGFFLSGAGR